MKPFLLFQKVFSKPYLRKLFEDKIARSSAVGRDGVRKGRFEDALDKEISIINRKVILGTYRFTGYKQRLISKGPDKNPRQISIPTFRDRLTLRALCEVLADVFSDAKIPPPHDYIKKIKENLLDVDDGFCFLRVDIKNYYPTIDQKILIRRVRTKIRKTELVRLIQNAISTPTGKKNIAENISKRGVPQGLSISNILSSVYLTKLDEKYKRDARYFRYVDDILIICRKRDAQSTFRSLKADLKKLKLECHDLKEDGSVSCSPEIGQ